MAQQQVFPTKGNLMASKRSLAQAQLGYELMDRKRNILIREMVALSDKAKEIRGSIDSVFEEAYKSLETANVMLGVVTSLAKQIPVENSVKVTYRSVMGVELPTITIDWLPVPAHSFLFAKSNSLSGQISSKVATWITQS